MNVRKDEQAEETHLFGNGPCLEGYAEKHPTILPLPWTERQDDEGLKNEQ